MPEGPEIRRSADQIARAVAGKRAEVVEFGQAPMKRHEKSLTGRKILDVETRGKALLTHFEGGLTIYSHNQLYGVWRIVDRGKTPNTRRSLRLALHTKDKSALLYSASDISVWLTDDIGEHPFIRKIGPDLLSQDISRKDIRDRLELLNFRNRQLAALYLDQAFIAGIGNYLRSEMLWDARVHPWHKPAQLDGAALGRLAGSTLKIMQRSYDTGGITNPPSRVKALKQKGMKRKGQYRFAVFDRDGDDCYRCGTEIVRSTVSSRRLYWCPDCQHESGPNG